MGIPRSSGDSTTSRSTKPPPAEGPSARAPLRRAETLTSGGRAAPGTPPALSVLNTSFSMSSRARLARGVSIAGGPLRGFRNAPGTARAAAVAEGDVHCSGKRAGVGDTHFICRPWLQVQQRAPAGPVSGLTQSRSHTCRSTSASSFSACCANGLPTRKALTPRTRRASLWHAQRSSRRRQQSCGPVDFVVANCEESSFVCVDTDSLRSCSEHQGQQA